MGLGNRRFTAAAIALCAGLLAAACGSDSPVTAPSVVAASPTPAPTATPPPVVASATTRYLVTFEAAWSRELHPSDFPADPHFSRLIGGTHSDRVNFWREGALATSGIEDMAELGATSPFDSEIEAAVARGTAHGLIRGGGVGRSPGSTGVDFEISRDHPRVTLVTMVAPSPDWFTGVHDLDLIENGDWVATKTVDLYPYDAGTDDGLSFNSADAESTPHAAIERIDGFPFSANGAVAPIGRFVFRRLP